MGAIEVTDVGRVTTCTAVTVVSSETGEIYRSGRVGEIWVSSPGMVDGYVTNCSQYESDQSLFYRMDLQHTTFAQWQEIAFASSGCLGFLWPAQLTSYRNGRTDKDDGMLLFVLGQMEDLIRADCIEDGQRVTYTFFPFDLESSIQESSENIVQNGW